MLYYIISIQNKIDLILLRCIYFISKYEKFIKELYSTEYFLSTHVYDCHTKKQSLNFKITNLFKKLFFCDEFFFLRMFFIIDVKNEKKN